MRIVWLRCRWHESKIHSTSERVRLRFFLHPCSWLFTCNCPVFCLYYQRAPWLVSECFRFARNLVHKATAPRCRERSQALQSTRAHEHHQLQAQIWSRETFQRDLSSHPSLASITSYDNQSGGMPPPERRINYEAISRCVRYGNVRTSKHHDRTSGGKKNG